MITGAHSIIYSKNPDADRDFFRDVLQLARVDVGEGWLIFGTKNIACGEVQDMGWGVLTQLTLPDGGKLGVYQPRHARPEPML